MALLKLSHWMVTVAAFVACALVPPTPRAQSSTESAAVPAPLALTGTYIPIASRPGVFTTRADLQDLATRINRTGSYSSKRFNQLTVQIARDLAGHHEWGAAYSGCSSDAYSYGFSYEPQSTHVVDHSVQLAADFHLGPGASPPAGAAVVASRLALYAALVKAGAMFSTSSPSADQAAALARQILIAWSARGFRDGHGRYLSNPNQFCDASGATNGNHTANQLAGLLALARVLDSRERFDAALSGAHSPTPVNLPWTSYFDRAFNPCQRNRADFPR